MSNPLLDGKRDECHLLLGNEAIVRGALEAGVHVVTCYPGTPSSEVPDTFRRIGGTGSRYLMQYSVNEKVAMEVACGAALAGGKALVTMKHVGVNVAADPLFTSAYTGLPGGLVVLSADDPGFHSSQNEQDNRNYARAASLPCFEPCSAQEAKDMTREAFRVARELEQPVLLRTTTRVNHMRGAVRFGDLPAEPEPIVEFRRNPMRFVPVPAVAKVRHKVLEENMARAMAIAETSPFTMETVPACQPDAGIIVSGVSRNYVSDALEACGWQDRVRVLELGMTWPLPEGRIRSFLAACSKVLVVEENDPLLETGVRVIAQKAGLGTAITGKGDILTIQGEYSTPLLTEALADFLGEAPRRRATPAVPDLPKRPPNLCAGCSHRAVFYAARQTFGDEAVYSSDIGCYTLGMLPPLRCADFLFCMGSSVSGGSGFAMVAKRPVVAFIGDSTFFHSGMTGLANAVFNRMDVVLVILDNGTTAMTGHQPNPGMLQDQLGDLCVHLDIESIVRGLGVTQIRKVKSFNLKSVTRALGEFREMTGVRVLIAEEPCALYARRALHKGGERYAVVAAQNEDTRRCFDTFACPAFCRRNGEYAVDEELCTGCGVCLQVAPKSFKLAQRG
ncbi:MAG: indolepyruvate ferredoxin oxidoreductase subunit alpha [Desulfovibrionaceae bacterium]|nr:indolepyruvate ferredoxin oxidoreductase subunit alpha [Desulfovibrionaceae bacterium]